MNRISSAVLQMYLLKLIGWHVIMIMMRHHGCARCVPERASCSSRLILSLDPSCGVLEIDNKKKMVLAEIATHGAYIIDMMSRLDRYQHSTWYHLASYMWIENWEASPSNIYSSLTYLYCITREDMPEDGITLLGLSHWRHEEGKNVVEAKIGQWRWF